MTRPTDSKLDIPAKLPADPGQKTSPKSAASGRPMPAQANVAFDKEVDDELQREWFNQIWEQYSSYIVAAAIAIVLAVGGYKYFEHRRQVGAEAAGAQYIAAIKQLGDGKTEPATEQLAAVARGNGGFAILARFRLAAADVATGKPAEALTKYEALSRERGIDPVLVDFARLQTAMLRLDTESWGDMQTRLTPLTADGGAWRYGARELLGMAALKAGKTDEARAQFDKLIADPAVPAGIADRARIMMGSLAAADLAAKTPVPLAAPAPQSGAAPTPPPAATPAPKLPEKKN